MSLKLNSSGSGSVTLQEPVTASNRTLNLPDVDATVLTDSAGVLNIGSGQVYKDASGNVGIGTTTPTISGNAFTTLNVRGVASNTGLITVTSNDLASSVQLYSGQSTSDNPAIGYQKNLRIGTTSDSGIQGFTERARFTSGGYFKAQGTSTYVDSTGSYHEFVTSADNNLTLYVKSNATNGQQYGIAVVTANDQNDATRYFLTCQGAATVRAQIRANGGLANYSANNVNLSDRREKTNFAPAKNYLDVICAIPVQTFNYINEPEEDSGLTLGVVAQDVQAVAPELVMESNWASKDEEPKMRLSIYQTDLQYALMKSIQELNAKVEAQAAEIAALKGAA